MRNKSLFYHEDLHCFVSHYFQYDHNVVFPALFPEYLVDIKLTDGHD